MLKIKMIFLTYEALLLVIRKKLTKLNRIVGLKIETVMKYFI